MKSAGAKPRSQLEARLLSGLFTVTGEIVPPRLPDFDSVRRKLACLEGLGCAINVTDNASANVKVCSLAMSAFLLQLGRDPVYQVTCRDRNRLAIQSDLLGALALGIRNVFVVTGDFITMGDHPKAAPVFDVDSIHVLQMFNRIRNEGVLASGVPLSASRGPGPARPPFFLGAAANPFADPLKLHVLKLKKKVLAGADFVQTQCVYDLERMREFISEVCEQGLHEKVYMLPGVMPVKSHRGLEYMRDNVPGMRVPEELIRRMKFAPDPQNEGIEIAAEIARSLRQLPGIAGIHIKTHLWVPAIPEVIERSGIMEDACCICKAGADPAAPPSCQKYEEARDAR